jgi:transcriptional regulator with XRE-family HTH domain
MVYSTLGSRIKFVRKNIGSQVIFSSMAGITQQYLSQLENDVMTNPSETLLLLIEAKTGFSAHWIRIGEGPMKVDAAVEHYTAEERALIAGYRAATKRIRKVLLELAEGSLEDAHPPGVYTGKELAADAVMDRAEGYNDPAEPERNSREKDAQTKPAARRKA